MSDIDPFADRNADDPSDPLSESYTGPQEVIEVPVVDDDTVTDPGTTVATPQEAPPAPAPAAAVPDPSPAGGQPGDPVTPGAPPAGDPPAGPKLLAGRFETSEQLEQGYREAERHMMATAAERNAFKKQYEDLASAVQTYVEAEKVRVSQQQQNPQAAQAAPTPVPEPTQAQLDALGVDRETYHAVIRPTIEAQVQAQVAPITQQLQATQQQQQQFVQQQQLARQQQMTAQQQQAQADSVAADAASVQGFLAEHPDYAVGTPLHQQMQDVINRWNFAWAQQDGNEFVYASREALDVAAEAAKRPLLARILELNPHYFDSAEGVELARSQATVMEATQRATTQQGAGGAPASPYVEGAASGAVPSLADPTSKDPMDAVIALDRQLRSRSTFE